MWVLYRKSPERQELLRKCEQCDINGHFSKKSRTPPARITQIVEHEREDDSDDEGSQVFIGSVMSQIHVTMSFKEIDELESRLVYKTEKKDKCTIRLCDDAKLFCLYIPCRVLLPLMKKVEDKINGFVKLGVIESVDKPTDWCVPMVVVPKPNGNVHLYIDLKKLNK